MSRQICPRSAFLKLLTTPSYTAAGPLKNDWAFQDFNIFIRCGQISNIVVVVIYQNFIKVVQKY